MYGKITEEVFNQVKECLNTNIEIDPPLNYVAESCGVSSGTVALIKKSGSFRAYKTYQRLRGEEYKRRRNG